MPLVRPCVFFAATVGIALLIAGSSPSTLRGANATTATVALPPSLPYNAQPVTTAGAPASVVKDDNLSFHLALLADATARAEAAGLPFTTQRAIDAFAPELQAMIVGRTLRITDSGDVQVYVLIDDTSAAGLLALETAGARIERVDEQQRIVQAEVPPAGLRGIAALAGVRQLRPPDYPVLNTGLVTSEGDAIVRASNARSTFGIDGSGVTVGVISDGVRGLAASQASGDLPPVDTTTCNVVVGAPDAAGAEGTAMLEIVHDLAPGANLMFGNFGFGTVLDFNRAVDCLAAHADVVVDDIGFFGVGPYDGSSIVSANTAGALNGPGPVRAYVTAVGNSAASHYQGTYVDSGTTVGRPPGSWKLHSFDVSGEPYVTKHAGLVVSPADHNRFRLRPGGVASIYLEWNDPWGASANDYDLLLGDGSSVSICSANVQDGVGGNDLPAEACTVQNNGTSVADVDILIGNYRAAAAARTFDLFLICSDCMALSNGNLLDFNTAGSSVSNQADAGGSPVSVTAVGAVRSTNPNAIEFFSSQGPTEDGRRKPDVVAPDGVCVTGAGGFASGNPVCQAGGRRFFGTSAAAPHVAAVAALLLQCDHTLDRAGLRNLLLDHATRIGGGPDNVFGYGLVDALGSGTAINCGQPTPTPSPSLTPLPTATPTITTTPTETPLGGGSTPTEPASTATPTSTKTPTSTATPTPTRTATPPCAAGDVDLSGVTDSVDAALILQYHAGLLVRLSCPGGADVNHDGRIDSIDAGLVLQYSAGLIPQL